MPPPDEPNAGGTFGFNSGRQPAWRRMGSALGGSAQAQLKFDIPGLQAFKAEIGNIKTVLGELDAKFRLISGQQSGIKAFSDKLAAVNGQLGALKTGAGAAKSFGTAPNAIPLPTFAGGAAGGAGAWGKAATSMIGGEAGAAAGAAGGPMAIATMISQAVGSAISKSVGAMADRFDRGAATAAGFDVYGSRQALYTGVNAARSYRALGASGQPFFGTAQDVQQQMYQQSQMGNVFGGTGIAGIRGGQAASFIQGAQYLAPGTTAQQAGGVLTGIQQNVQGMRQGQALFGAAASLYSPGGGMKSMTQYFNGILQRIQRGRTGNNAGKPLTKDEIMAVRMPGSNIYSWFAQLGWDEQTINMFFDWAIANAAAGSPGGGFEPTEASMKKIRGPSLATEVQKTQETQATRDTEFAGQQYKALITQQRRDQQMIDVLTKVDNTLNKLYGVLGQVPTGTAKGLGNMVGKATSGALLAGAAVALAPETFGLSIPAAMLLGGGSSLLSGVGDPGPQTSQLNPDVRKRVNAMMAANPRLSVVSGFRTSMQQKRLYESGNPNVARPGKSQHTRGNAADLGPPSQYGWIAANARKFGLDHAGAMGEPWHVQNSGTISGIGDPEMPAGDKWAISTAGKQSGMLAAAFAKYVQEHGSQGGAPATTPAGTGTSVTADVSGNAPTSGTVDINTVVKAAYQAGFRGDDLINFSAIPARETHYRTDAANINATTRDESYGLWQINVRKDANYTTAKDFLGSEDWTQLYDPYKSAQLGFIMYQRSGNTLQPWGGYKGMSNVYDVPQDAFDSAKTAAATLYPGGYGDVGVGTSPTSYNGSNMTSLSHQQVVFNNTFHVTAAPGTDTEALARNLSPRLEAQIRRAAGMRK